MRTAALSANRGCGSGGGKVSFWRMHLLLFAIRMQQWFGVAVGLIAAFEYEIARCAKGDAVRKIPTHSFVLGIIRVLPVDDRGHTAKRLTDLILGADAMQ